MTKLHPDYLDATKDARQIVIDPIQSHMECTENKSLPSAVIITGRERLLDTFFKVDRLTFSYERFDGTMSEPCSRLVLERGDAVAALLYDPERRKVITIKQFRAPVYGKGDGWIIEAVAGIIDEGESPQEALTRELAEETGYRAKTVEPICIFYPSPGGCSEKIYLYYAEVSAAAKLEAQPEAGEDIQIVEFDLEDFLNSLRCGCAIQDSKLAMAGYWLMARVAEGTIR